MVFLTYQRKTHTKNLYEVHFVRTLTIYCLQKRLCLLHNLAHCPTMKNGFLRRFLCGSLGGLSDIKEVVMDGAAGWRSATLYALRRGRASPPIPRWITIPNEHDHVSYPDSPPRSDFVEEDWPWLIPKHVLDKQFWPDESSTEDDGIFACNRIDDDDNSYTPPRRISWQQSSY